MIKIKNKHAFWCGVICLVQVIVYHVLGANNESLRFLTIKMFGAPIAVVITNLIGLAKEYFYDPNKEYPTNFDWLDIKHNFIGSSLGAVSGTIIIILYYVSVLSIGI